jgi:uncharacterized membrane protein YkvA (DUF1232 family)
MLAPPRWWAWLVFGVGVLLASWALLVVPAARLPDSSLEELACFLPDCATTARCLRGDPRVPTRAKLAVGFAVLWVLSPIDLIPELLPVVAQLDDIVVVALAFRYAARRCVALCCWRRGQVVFEWIEGERWGASRCRRNRTRTRGSPG